MTIAESVAALQTRLATARREFARAEGAADSAQATADKARADMLEEFGVDSVADAQQLLNEARAELAAKVAEINAILDDIEA